MTMTIGEVSKRTGIGVETIRFYEREGLIPKPPRRSSGYRSFPPDTVRRLRFIRRTRDHGFTLQEIKELFELRALPGEQVAEVRKQLAAKLEDIRRRIEELQTLEGTLVKIDEGLKKKKTTGPCPVLDAFEEPVTE